MIHFHRPSRVPVALFLAAATFGTIGLARPALATRVVAAPVDLRVARDLGRAPAAAPVHLVFSMKLRDERGLRALVAAQSNPRSPIYRSFLRPQQLRDAFGATAAQYAATLASLRSAGFSVHADPLRTIVDAAAPVALVERYFGTRLDTVIYNGRRSALANATPATMPLELRSGVSTVSGLDAAPLYETALSQAYAGHQTGGASARALTVAPNAAPSQTTAPTPPAPPPANGPDGGYGPQLIDASFNYPERHGYFGSGVAVADLIDGTFGDLKDIDPYLAEFGVTRTGPHTTTVVVDGGCGGENDCFDSFSAALDAQGVLGVAPRTSSMRFRR